MPISKLMRSLLPTRREISYKTADAGYALTSRRVELAPSQQIDFNDPTFQNAYRQRKHISAMDRLRLMAEGKIDELNKILEKENTIETDTATYKVTEGLTDPRDGLGGRPTVTKTPIQVEAFNAPLSTERGALYTPLKQRLPFAVSRKQGGLRSILG